MEQADHRKLGFWPDRARATRWSAWTLVSVGLLGLGLQRVLGPLPGWLLALALIFVAGFLSVLVALRSGGSPRRAGVVLVFSTAGLIVTMALGHGGLDAPFLTLLALLPLGAGFLLGGRAGWVTAGSICFLMLALVLLHTLTDLVLPLALERQLASSARAAWLSATALLTALVIWLYDERGARASHQLWVHATRDHLTGLANRRHFEELLAVECRRAARDGGPLSIVLLDIDRFKAFNDTYGHPHGDRCLVAVAYGVGTCVRRAGDLLARFGGEELIAVFPGTNENQAAGIAESMRLAVREMEIPHRGSPAGVVTISLGVASARGAGQLDPDGLVQRVDEALYRAKEGGRDRVESASPARSTG